MIMPLNPRLRHWIGFFGSGSLAFAVDYGVLQALMFATPIGVLAARVISISVAMVVGWLCHRTFTFAVAERPSVAEFVRYFGVAWTAAALNYAVFALVMLLRPVTDTLVAIVLAGAVAMVASYLGMRFGAFNRPQP